MALVADPLDDLPAPPHSRAALPLSLLLHGTLLAAALWFLHPQPHDDPAELESVAVDIINLQTASDGDVIAQSDATQSLVAAGATAVAVAPIETVPRTTQPVTEPDVQQPVTAATLEPTDPAEHPPVTTEMVEPAQPQPMERPPIAEADATTPETSTTSTVKATFMTEAWEPIAATRPAVTPLLAATQPFSPVTESMAEITPAEAVPSPDAGIATQPALVELGSLEPSPAASSIEPAEVQTATIEPSAVKPASVEPASLEPAKLETIEPAPQAAIETEAKPKPPEPVKQTEPEPKPKKPPPKKQAATRGSGGKSDANAQASAAPKGGSGKVVAGGSAAESRYPGLVQARLKRALRSPPGGRRGQAYVSFLVHADGSVSDIQVVGSTGVAALDDAAAATVRRAAPFPPIPADANRPAWPFTLPLRFR